MRLLIPTAMLSAALLFSQQTFEAATVKPSKSNLGHDGQITTNPTHFTARNATLKRLLFEAWQVSYSQIVGGPSWLDTDEFDIEAKSDIAATLPQLRRMLEILLTERFKLSTHFETKEGRVYALLPGKGGTKLSVPNNLKQNRAWTFHGTLGEFANILAIQLTIAPANDPTTISRASGPPIPVINKTGLEGTYDLALDLQPEPAADPFALWQHALQEQLGLKLESQRAPINTLHIDRAEKIATNN